MKLLVFSESDKAGVNIANALISRYGFERSGDTYQGKPIYKFNVENEAIMLVSIAGDVVDSQFIGQHFKPSLVVFLSRHASLSGTATLSIHAPGNLGAETYGGLPYKLSIAPANAMKAALIEMNRLVEDRGLKFKVSYEATHHGPSLDIPSMFVEIGSTQREWEDVEAGEVVAEAAMAAVQSVPRFPAALAVGGPHYNPKFTNVGLWGDLAPAHIVSKYALENLKNMHILKTCVERTLEKVQHALIDWKGIPGGIRGEAVDYLKSIGLDIVRV
ncbi:hypothetical protein KEJ27_04545 [Candidatus Bathyarchaeota archaeon]|nr:hypothetical protein [Candidatus Bathyarchaeota archaeon]MBS7613800.1 hypothetical protein [Candidatus Bathyarchaeota archaeon]MBS7618771.1 hypothetical protein [Candidatus Bathyarchaeota archaeon]